MWVWILGTMLLSGVLGGTVNKFISDPNQENPLQLWKHIIIGIAASFVVPVFLGMISSTLLSNVVNSAKPSENLLLLGGFCLIAAISSRAFIQSVSERVMKEVANAKKDASEAKLVAGDAKQLAIRAEDIASVGVEAEASNREERRPQASSPPKEVSEVEKSILKALTNSRYALRSSSGLASETGLRKNELTAPLLSLTQKNLVDSKEGKDGMPRWYITAEGSTLVNK